MKPYYDHAGITIYHGDCREVLPTLTEPVDLVLTDPPYGVSERCDRKQRKRGALATCNDFPQIYGDSEPFDPAHLLGYRRVILFGGNHYANSLPESTSWIVWDKVDGLTSSRESGFNDNGDAELAWTNLSGPVRLYSHRWMGMLKDSERNERRVHPTQKPVSLMLWCLTQAKATGLVLDPYMGSGPVLVAAKQMGLPAIGIEIEERYCEIAAQRLSQEVLALA